jgi:hypothetical protein
MQLHLQAGGLFITPCIEKPYAAGNWTIGADSPDFMMDDSRLGFSRLYKKSREIEKNPDWQL